MKKKYKLSLLDYIFFISTSSFLVILPIIILNSIEKTNAIIVYNNKAILCKRVDNYVGDTAECIISFRSRYSSRKTLLIDNVNAVYYKEENNKEYEYLKSILGYYEGKRIPKKLLDNINLLK